MPAATVTVYSRLELERVGRGEDERASRSSWRCRRTAGSMSTASAAAASTGSEKATSMLVVMSAVSASPATGWVTEIESTSGARASTVLAT